MSPLTKALKMKNHSRIQVSSNVYVRHKIIVLLEMMFTAIQRILAREFRNSEVEGKLTSNSLRNRGLLSIKMINLEILHIEMRIHYFNVNIILIDGKKSKNFKQRKSFIEGEFID